MAKTIREMADNKYPIYDDVWMHNAYIEGAKAVLKEIEAMLSVSQVRSYHEIYDELLEKIKELKEE